MRHEQQTNSLMLQLKKHLDLAEEPFSEQATFFFEGAQRRHNLETLKHLATFGDLVLFLTGEKGAGKTHLLRQFEKEVVNDLRVIFIDCNLSLQSGSGRQVQIAQTCLKEMDIPLKDESFEESCQRLLEAAERQVGHDGRRTIVIYDCADKLPRQQVLALCGFSRNLAEESPLVFLFSGTHGLLQNSKLGTNLEQNAWWHQIQMKPLSQNEIVDYLNQALTAAGYKGALELSEQQLAQLIQVGKGLPGRINKIFPSVLLEPGLLKLPNLGRNKSISLRVMAGLAGLLVISFLLVAFQHGVFERLVPVFSLDASDQDLPAQPVQVFSAKEDAEKQQAARLALLNAELEKQALSLEEKPVESDLLEGAEAQAMTEEATPNVILSESNELVNVEQTDVVKASTLTEEMAESSAVAVVSSEAPSADSSKVTPIEVAGKPLIQKAKVESKVRGAPFREKSWLQSQPKGAYIPQILGSFDEQTALKFIRQLGDQKFDTYYLETEHKGRPWFVVFYGVFATKAEAQAAIQDAPERIKRQSPWLRSVEGVLGSYPKNSE